MLALLSLCMYSTNEMFAVSARSASFITHCHSSLPMALLACSTVGQVYPLYTLHTCTASSLDTHTSITGRCTRCTLPPAHTLALGRPHYACTVWPLNAFQFAPHWSAQHARMWTIAPPPPRFTVTSGAARVKCKCLPETREPSNVAKVKRRTVMVTAFLKTCRKRGLHRHSPTRYFSSLSSSSAFSSGLSLSSRFRSEGPHNRLFTSGRAIALGQPKNDLRPTALVCVDRDIY